MITERSRHFTASAVVIDLQRRMVLLVDHLASSQRQLPGGHVDPDETGHETALREVYEETGVHARLWAPQALTVPGGTWMPTPWMVCEFPAPAKPHKGEPAHRHIDLLYLAVADSTAPLTTQPEEVAGAVWMPIDGLDAAAVRADVPVVVPMAWQRMTDHPQPCVEIAG